MQAVSDLMSALGDRALPEPLISQYLAASYPQVMSGATAPTAPALIRAAITRVLQSYDTACAG